MAFSAFTALAVYPGDGETTTFAIPDKFYDAADVQMFVVDADGLEVSLDSGTDFNVTVQTTEDLPPGRKTGTCVTTLAPADGSDVVVFIWPGIDQDQPYEGRPVTPRQRERVVDRLAMKDAALRELFFRGFRAPLNTPPGLRFIVPGEAGSVPQFDGFGNLILGPKADVISNAQGYSEDAKDQADYAKEWAQSDEPISVEAGGDGSTDRPAKWWAQLSEQVALPDEVITESKINGAFLETIARTLQADLTVNIPTDYATLQAAIDDLSTLAVKQGARIILNIESGHRPASGTYLEHGDYSHFRIESEDATVVLADTFPTDQDFLSGMWQCKMPVLACLVDGNSRCDRGMAVWYNSSAVVDQFCGVINSNRLGLYAAHNSYVFALRSNWSGANDRCIWATRQSQVDAEYVTMNNSGSAPTSQGINRVVYASRNSLVNISEGEIDGCVGIGLDAQRSRIVAVRTTIKNVGNVGINVSAGSTVVFNEGEIDTTGSHGILILGGGYCSGQDADIIDAGSDGVAIRDGGSFSGRGVTVTNPSGVGINAESGSEAAVHNAVLTGAGSWNIRVSETSKVVARSATCTGGGTSDCRVFLGSQLLANGMTTTNGAGSPNFGDIGGATVANTWTADGVVWV